MGFSVYLLDMFVVFSLFASGHAFGADLAVPVPAPRPEAPEVVVESPVQVTDASPTQPLSTPAIAAAPALSLPDPTPQAAPVLDLQAPTNHIAKAAQEILRVTLAVVQNKPEGDLVKVASLSSILRDIQSTEELALLWRELQIQAQTLVTNLNEEQKIEFKNNLNIVLNDLLQKIKSLKIDLVDNQNIFVWTTVLALILLAIAVSALLVVLTPVSTVLAIFISLAFGVVSTVTGYVYTNTTTNQNEQTITQLIENLNKLQPNTCEDCKTLP